MPLTGKRESAVAAAIAAAVFVLFYAASPAASFLQWDDAANLIDNDQWRGLSWGHLKWMWSTRHYGPWQPLSWFTWAVDFILWGLNPESFRRTSIALHSLTAGVFFLACRRLMRSPLGAVGAAVLFALHPLRVESVVWITERRDVLSGFFVVSSICLWLSGYRRSSAAAFLCGALSKGTGIAVIPFIFFADVFARRRDARKTAASLLPHAVIAAFAAVMNLRGFQTGDIHAIDFGAVDRILIAMSGSWFYLSKTLFPFGLSPYYELPLRRELYPGALSALLITAGCFHKRIRAWAVPVWFAYLLALAPVSGLLQNGRQAAADRYSYLACMPFAVLFGLMLEKLRPRAAAGVVASTAVFLSVLTARQTKIWGDDISLWTRAVAVMPASYVPNANLSAALLSAHREEEAIPFLQTAAALEPKDAGSRVNLGFILAKKGDEPSAIRLFSEAVALHPDDPAFAAARYNLGVLLVRAGRKSDGLAHMREAVRLNPSLGR